MDERRMEDVEVKLAYLERHLEELDGVVRAMAGRIAALMEEVERIRDERGASPSDGRLADEVPPHHDRL